MDQKSLLLKDLRHSWHPYTQMSTLVTEPPLLIDRAEGLFLFDADGNRYYDAISSWWCQVHGHGHDPCAGRRSCAERRNPGAD